MKQQLIVGLFLAPIVAAGQSGSYAVNGKVGNYNAPAKVYLIHQSGGQNSADSAVLKNGVFQFKGTVDDPFSATLVMDYKGAGLPNLNPQERQDVLGIYVEKGVINIQSTDSLYKAEVSGSPLNKDNEKLRDMLKSVGTEMAALNAEWAAASAAQKSSEEFKQKLMEKYEAIQTAQHNVLKNFIKGNPGSYVSLDALNALAGSEPDFTEIEPLFSLLDKKLQETVSGKALSEAITLSKKTALGSVAADFTQNDTAGKPVKLSNFRGKYVLLDFWASWCGPCRQENPNVVRVYNKYKDKNFTVLGVSLDRGREAWLKAIKDDGLTWTHVSDLKYWNNEAAQQYGVQSIPQNFLLDPEGRIIAKNLRGEELDQKLKEVLKP